MKQSTTSLKTLWDEWKQFKNQDAGNKLVEHYMPLVDYQVNRIFMTLPKNIDRQEVKSYAFMGLVDALEKFDIDRDLKFDTYASFRIRGAIIDGLRKEDWLPRTVRDKAKLIEQAHENLEKQLQRTPTLEEVAKEVDMDVQTVAEITRDTLFANLLSIESKTSEVEDEHRDNLRDLIKDDGLTPEEQIEHQERIEELTQLISQLNEKEKLVISLFYKEDLTLTEIGDVLNLTTSRISQIHSQALAKLRKLLVPV